MDHSGMTARDPIRSKLSCGEELALSHSFLGPSLWKQLWPLRTAQPACSKFFPLISGKCDEEREIFLEPGRDALSAFQVRNRFEMPIESDEARRGPAGAR